MTKSSKQFLAEFGNRVSIVSNQVEITNNMALVQGSDFYLQPNAGIHANGGFGVAGQVLTSNGSAAYWGAGGGGNGSVNTAAQYTWTNTHTFTADIKLDGIIANNTLGTAGQLLATDGTKVYWAGAGGASVNTDAQYTWTNTHTFTNVVTFSSGINAGGNTGANGQVLTSNGTAVLWTNAGSGSVNTAAQYIWTNTHTFTNLITISTNGGASNGYMKWGEDNTSFVTLNLQPSDNNFVFYRSTVSGNNQGEPVMAWFYNPDPANTFQKSVTFIQDIMLFGGIYDNYGGSKGKAGQVLSATGNASGQGVKWIDAAAASVNTAAQYTWTNTHTFTDLITISTNGGTTNGYMKWGEDPTSFVTLNLQPSDNNFVFYRSLRTGSQESVMAWFYNPDPANTFQKSVTFTQDIMLFGGIYDNYGGSKGTAGQILSATGNASGQGVKWINAVAGSVNTSAQYTWTNTHIFSYSGASSNVVTIQNSVQSAYLKFNFSGSGTPRESTIGMQTDGKFIINSTLNNGTVNPVLGWWSNANSTLAPDIESTVPGQAGNGLFVQVPLVLRNGIVPYNTNSRGTAGQVLTATGEAYPAAGLKWADIPGGGGSVNTAASYTWTNTHTFNSTATFNGTISATKYNLAGGGSINNNGTGISVPGNIQADGSATSISVATAGGIQAGFYAGGGGRTCGFYIGTDNATHMACGTTATTFDTAGNFFIPGYLSPPKGIYATNGLGSSGQVLTSTGSGVQWSTAGGGGTAPGNKGPITVTTDASWSLNSGVVQNTNLAGSISPSKIDFSGGLTISGQIGINGNGGDAGMYTSSGGNAASFLNNPAFSRAYIASGGQVQAGFYNSGDMRIAGEGYKPAGTTWATGAPRLAKKNVEPFTKGLNDILSLNIINYQLNGSHWLAPDDGKTYAGFDVEHLKNTNFKNVIQSHTLEPAEESMLTVRNLEEIEAYNIDEMIYASFNAIKELNSLVTNLTEENKKLRADMDSLLNKTQAKKK